MRAIHIANAGLLAIMANPHHKLLAVFSEHRTARDEFRRVADEITEKLGELPIVISMSELTIRMPEGGKLRFMSIADHNDVHRINGMEIHDFWFDESYRAPAHVRESAHQHLLCRKRL